MGNWVKGIQEFSTLSSQLLCKSKILLKLKDCLKFCSAGILNVHYSFNQNSFSSQDIIATYNAMHWRPHHETGTMGIHTGTPQNWD